MGLVLILGHSTVLREKYYPDNLMLRSRYFKKNNIQELKTRPLLRELAPNINSSFIDLSPKERELPRKKKREIVSLQDHF